MSRTSIVFNKHNPSNLYHGIMKFICTLLTISAGLLSSCVHTAHDPDYDREAKHIQNIDYPADKIVGSWMQVGYENLAPANIGLENRIYMHLRPDGTGLTTHVQIVPPIYKEYQDLYEPVDPPVNYDDQYINEGEVVWKYLGKNQWEIKSAGNVRIKSMPSWLASSDVRPGPPGIARYHNGKLFFPKAHSSAVSILDENDAKAKLATIRAVNSTRFRASLEARRRLLRMHENMQAPAYPQATPSGYLAPGYYGAPYGTVPAPGYNTGYGQTQYLR